MHSPRDSNYLNQSVPIDRPTSLHHHHHHVNHHPNQQQHQQQQQSYYFLDLSPRDTMISNHNNNNINSKWYYNNGNGYQYQYQSQSPPNHHSNSFQPIQQYQSNNNVSLSPPPSPPGYRSPLQSPPIGSMLRTRIFNSFKGTDSDSLFQPPQTSPNTSSSSSSSSLSPNNKSLPTSPASFVENQKINRAVIPLLNLKGPRLQSSQVTPTISPKSISSTPTSSSSSSSYNSSTVPDNNSPPESPLSTNIQTPRTAHVTDLLLASSLSSPRQLSSSTPLPQSPPQSSSNNQSINSPNSSPQQDDQQYNSELYNKRAEEQWKKLEYYTNDFGHFIFEAIKNKEFSQLVALNSKLSEITTSVQEIEITNNIFKTLPPQTRARKKRATKAEKLKKGVLGIKRAYVTTPKSKGNYCIFCGTMETPEWRKGPGGLKTLCNACGLHYAKNIKKEGMNQVGGSEHLSPRLIEQHNSNNNPNNSNDTSPTSSSLNISYSSQTMNVASLLSSFPNNNPNNEVSRCTDD